MNATSEQAFDTVAAQAESIKSDREHRIEVMDVGDEVRQGDIYLTRIANVPATATAIANPSLQLAPGETQGSRHCLRSIGGLRVFRLTDAGPLDGPILEAGTEFAVDHPEHGNRILPAGCYAVTYQRAFGEDLRAVAD